MSKKLEIRFHVSEETYELIKKLAEEYEMTIAAFVKLNTIQLTKNE